MGDAIHDTLLTTLRNRIRSGQNAAEGDAADIQAALSISEMQIRQQLRRFYALETPLIGVEKELKEFTDRVADYPPAPPTSRGRLGRVAIRFGDGLLWWISERTRKLSELLLGISRLLSDQTGAVAATLEEYSRVATVAREQQIDLDRRIRSMEAQTQQIRKELAELREKLDVQRRD